MEVINQIRVFPNNFVFQKNVTDRGKQNITDNSCQDTFTRQNAKITGLHSPKIVSFTSIRQDKSELQINTSTLADEVPDNIKINDDKARKLINMAKEQAISNKKNNTAVFSESYNGVALCVGNPNNPDIYTAGNFEIAKDFTQCGERNSLSELLSKNSKPAYDKDLPPYEIIAIALSKDDLVSDNNSIVVPCPTCLTWLYKIAEKDVDTAKHIQIITPVYNKQKREPEICIRTLKDYLPQIENRVPSYSKEDIDVLLNNDIEYSDSAKKLGDKRLTKDQIKRLLTSAKQAYEERELATATGKNAGAAVLMDNDEIYTGNRIEATSPRHFVSADFDAMTNAREFSEKGTKADAIAFFSKDDNSLPYPDTFTWFDTKEFTNKDNFQIVRIEKDADAPKDIVKVYTMNDFMPYRYKRGKI